MIVENADMLCTNEATDMNFERGCFYKYGKYIGQEFHSEKGKLWTKKNVNKVGQVGDKGFPSLTFENKNQI